MTAKTIDWERATELAGKGLSCSRIAQELGVAKSSVSRWASREGITFDRTKTERATKASRVDRASRRAAIIERLYEQTENTLDRLDQGEIDPRDVRDLSTAMSNFLERATRLELADGDPNISAAESMLGRLGMAFGIINADGTETEDDGEVPSRARPREE